MMIAMNKIMSTENQHIFLATCKDLGVGPFNPVENYWTIPKSILDIEYSAGKKKYLCTAGYLPAL